jgi:hypothetical protein
MKASLFKKLLSKEARKRIKDLDIYYARRSEEISSLSNKNLVSTAKYYLTQMECLRKYDVSAPVYDSVFYHIIIPELLERLNETD